MNPNDSFPKDNDFLEVAEFSFGEVREVVSGFYSKVAVDPLLKKPFASVDNWSHHIERLTHFWWVRLGGKPYLQTRYNPVKKHFLAGFDQNLLKQWLTLFESTLNKSLAPDKARLWLNIANSMGSALTLKNELYRQNIK
ncbi:MAG: group III truncated hemoglobin [Bdellovibrionales bacterium]